MSLAGAFLGGAQDRLLAASIPFRFFLSAVLFHLLAWALLFLAANEVAGFRGGTGLTLAVVHLVTLGVFSMTAIGASYQLLPVVTRRPLARDWPARLSFWLFLPGIPLLAFGMAMGSSAFMSIGAILVCCGFVVFAVLTADNLRRASSIPVVSAHGWLALVSLFAVAGSGVTLVWNFENGFLAQHGSLAVIHMLLASFGFMGFLVLGFSLVLIPMFALSGSPPNTFGWAQGGLTGLSLAAAVCGILTSSLALVWLSLVLGICAAGCYLWLMHTVLRSRMRKRLGLPFVLIRVSWLLLLLGLLILGAVIGDIGLPNAPALAGFVVLAGWLLTFLLGVLQRIMPFLASMHAAGKSGMPPLLSELTSEGPLKAHLICHFCALALCCTGLVADKALLIQLGVVSGLAGAIAFAMFAINVALKLNRSAQAA